MNTVPEQYRNSQNRYNIHMMMHLYNIYTVCQSFMIIESLWRTPVLYSVWISDFVIIVFSYYSMSQTSSKDSHLSQDTYFKCTHKCLLFNWIILILSYTLIGYLIADIHIYKLLIYPIYEGIYYTDRISNLYSYIFYRIGQALWNRDRIYIVIDICPISEEI